MATAPSDMDFFQLQKRNSSEHLKHKGLFFWQNISALQLLKIKVLVDFYSYARTYFSTKC